MFYLGAFFSLIFFAAPAVGEERRTLAEWERIITADDLHWRSSGRGSRGEWVENLTALASKEKPEGDTETPRAAAFKLGAYYLKMETSSHENRFLAWRWFREAGGDDHALAQLALGYVFLSLAEEFHRRDHTNEIHDTLVEMGEPAISALENAVAREEDPALKRAAAWILHDVRKRIRERK